MWNKRYLHIFDITFLRPYCSNFNYLYFYVIRVYMFSEYAILNKELIKNLEKDIAIIQNHVIVSKQQEKKT